MFCFLTNHNRITCITHRSSDRNDAENVFFKKNRSNWPFSREGDRLTLVDLSKECEKHFIVIFTKKPINKTHKHPKPYWYCHQDRLTKAILTCLFYIIFFNGFSGTARLCGASQSKIQQSLIIIQWVFLTN